MTEGTISHDQEAGRFELHLGEERVSLLDYRVRDDAVDFVHTRTDPDHRGRGFAGRVTAAAVDHARDHGWQVRPLCSFVRQWMAEHPDSQDLVPAEERSRFLPS